MKTISSISQMLILVYGIFAACTFHSAAQTTEKELVCESRYLNFPVSMKHERQKVCFLEKQDTVTYSEIRIPDDEEPDYWVFMDISAMKGKKITLTFTRDVRGIGMIYQSDRIPGEGGIYLEKYRPRFHFTSRRGWNNDPNGLIYHKGEYHLFYQHNPYETQWGNMHWGHAISTDLIHWKELPDALYPDRLGTMFSGSAVTDRLNTAGFGKDALVAVYTADRNGTEVQCLAYSLDKGRTFSKYDKNPVTGGTRDPKVFWYEPGKHWVMALYKDAGISILTSDNLKEWKETDFIKGFYECPELFELPVRETPGNKLWVLYGGSGTYMLGIFNGSDYTPVTGKYRNAYGAHYAAQTYNDTPDGRRIQIAWGRIEQPGMPFNQMMLFPTELTLRNTSEGIRLFSEPVGEIKDLKNQEYVLSGLSAEEANSKMSGIKSDLLRIEATLESVNGSGITINYRGNRIVYMDADEMNGIAVPLANPEQLLFDVEVLIDRTSSEVYFQKGRIVLSEQLKVPSTETGPEILGNLPGIKIHRLIVTELKSIWN